MANYNVFLSYSTEDLRVVANLADALQQLNLRVWFDQTALVPGAPWQRELTEGVEASSATAVCIGAGGVGKWQQVEMEAAITKQVEGRHRVIPVILPGVLAENVKLPALLKRNTWVVMNSNVEDRATLERLYWGITGENFASASAPRARKDPPQSQALDDSVSNLCDTLCADNVVYIVGTGAPEEGGASFPPSPCEITRGLLLDLRLIENDYNHLLPPPDIAGSYYAVRSGTTRLEGKVVEMISSRSGSIPRPYQRLAELIRLLAGRPTPRIRKRPQQLIVTTNLDVMIERALLQAGISFTRLVQHTSMSRIEVNQYRNVSLTDKSSIQLPTPLGARTVRLNDWDDLDEAIANHGRSVAGDISGGTGVNALHTLPIKDLSGDDPILYKFRGSQDVRGSCALSVDQYLTYTRRLLIQSFIPAQITEILNSSPILLLGYGFFDSDFRLIYHGLLRGAVEIRQDPIYSIQLTPDEERHDSYRKMELLLWDKVKEWALRDLKITTVESPSEGFLQLLIEGYRSRSGVT
jgi:hypothetical protein